MPAIITPVSPNVRMPSSRRIHRIICVVAGALAAVGGVLALVVHPWFVAIAALGGISLILSTESKCHRVL